MAESGARAGLGLRVHTGWATAVLVRADSDKPVVVARERVDLVDPAVPESDAPFHAALELGVAEGEAVVARARAAIEAMAERRLGELLARFASESRALRGVGLVVGSVGDPARLGNAHVRAHASEGALFRDALAGAAKARGLPVGIYVEKRLWEDAGTALGRGVADLKGVATELGEPVGRPWRAEEKTAAVAAWLSLGA